MEEESDLFPVSDYECFIHVHNKTNVDFSLFESKPGEGAWGKGSLPNTIEGGTRGLIQLNDKSGKSLRHLIVMISSSDLLAIITRTCK